MKTCSKCGLDKEPSDFYKGMAKCKECHKRVTRDWQLRSKEKVAEIARNWYHRTPENRQYSIDKARNWQRNNSDNDKDRKFRYNMQRLYGLSYERYREMAEFQNGVCAICGLPPYRNLDIDHCHSTGKIRGLLCAPCNTVLGLLKENPTTAEKVAEYLRKHNA